LKPEMGCTVGLVGGVLLRLGVSPREDPIAKPVPEFGVIRPP
jgi:hypothetical protein